MIPAFILSFLFGIVGMVLMFSFDICDNKTLSRMISILSFLFCGMFVSEGVNMLSEHNKPKAIDVYRDKTDLKVIYEVVNNDTIVTDSIVVFK